MPNNDILAIYILYELELNMQYDKKNKKHYQFLSINRCIYFELRFFAY